MERVERRANANGRKNEEKRGEGDGRKNTIAVIKGNESTALRAAPLYCTHLTSPGAGEAGCVTPLGTAERDRDLGSLARSFIAQFFR